MQFIRYEKASQHNHSGREPGADIAGVVCDYGRVAGARMSDGVRVHMGVSTRGIDLCVAARVDL